jgi:UDP-N-acetylmuramyl pentapeptide phosphotransferase/UDP-N-acetylglucosamine-1-phosphate transferase
MPAFLRPFISGIVGSIVAGAVAWLAARGINLDQDSQAKLVEWLVGFILPLFGTIFSITHKTVAKYTNPGDAATSQLAEEHHIENEQLKAAGTNSPSVIH